MKGNGHNRDFGNPWTERATVVSIAKADLRTRSTLTSQARRYGSGYSLALVGFRPTNSGP